jgi:two-component system, cell cycle sensor histidine kinase and response regulator CckA
LKISWVGLRSIFNRPLKLSSHLIALVLAALLPLLIFTFAMFRQKAQLQHETVERGMRDTARALSLALDREIGALQAILETLAESPHLDTGNLKGFYDIGSRALANRKESRLILFDRSGLQLINTSRPFGSPLPNPFQDRSAPQAADTYRELPLGAPEAFKQAIETGRLAVSDMFIALDSRRPTIGIIVPVVRNGQVIYALKLAFHPRVLTQLLHEERLPADWIAGLVDKKGVFIARTKEPERFVGRAAGPELLRQLAESQEGWGTERTFEGIPVYHAFAKSDLTGWATRVAVSQAVINAPINHSIAAWGIGAIVLFLLGVTGAAVLGKRISTPIATLAESAAAIQRGEPVELPASGVREVTELHSALISAGEATRLGAAEREGRLIEQRMRHLAELGAALSESIDYEKTLNRLAELMVPDHADWCVIDLLQEDSNICRRIAVRTSRKEMEPVAEEFLHNYAPDLKRPHPILKAIETGQPDYTLDADESWAGPRARDTRHRFLLEQLQVRSVIIAPLRVRGRVIGTFSLVASRYAGRKYTMADVQFAEEVSRRASVALDNALLFHELSKELSERKRVEATLRQVSERLELAQQVANVGAFERDLVTNELTWSASQEKLYGLLPGSFSGKHADWAARVHPDDLVAIEAAIARAAQNKTSLNLEFRIIRPDGAERWVAGHARVFVDEQGNMRRLLGVNIDITERKLAEQALARSRDQFERMAATTPDFLFIYDLIKGRNVYENKRMEEHLGYTGAQLKLLAGDSMDALVHPNDLAPVRAQYRRFDTAADGAVLEWEFRLRHADGSYRWFHVRATVFDRTDHGRVCRIIGHSRDVTLQKETEAALKRFTEDLEKLVADRTGELVKSNAELLQSFTEREKLQDQLRQAQKMEAIGTLAGGIAHDFNNILGIILGYAQELLDKEREDPAERSRNVGVILGAAERGAKVVKQLLTFARKTGTEHKPLDVNSLVRETVDILREIFPKTMTFRLDLDPTLPGIQGDHNQLQQSLINISLNAKDAMPEGGTLSVRTSRTSAAEIRNRFLEAHGSYIRIAVSDTGAGMDEDIRQRVFEPFFTTKSERGGTGLGLSVVYGIVQAHHGFIDVESQAKHGTSFKLFLPIYSQTVAPLEPESKGRKEVLSTGTTVLIVEDETHLRELIRLSAQKRGFRVLTAKDGEEALDVYQNHWQQIDSVLLDWGLPRLGGSAVFRKLKEMNPAVQVIGVSGYVDFELRESMLKEGVRDFLQKPCTPDEILGKVLSSCQPVQTTPDSV